VAFDSSSPGSGVAGSTISGGYVGVYATRALDLAVTDTTVSSSAAYGIEIRGGSGLLLSADHVEGAGIHGVVLGDGATTGRVLGTTVDGARANGILIYQHATGMILQGGKVSNSSDGIVIQDASSNQVLDYSIGPVARFGVRVTGSSHDNLIQGTQISGAALGVYIYAGPSANRFLKDVFASNKEDLRIRNDAPGNFVDPVPPLSELDST